MIRPAIIRVLSQVGVDVRDTRWCRQEGVLALTRKYNHSGGFKSKKAPNSLALHLSGDTVYTKDSYHTAKEMRKNKALLKILKEDAPAIKEKIAVIMAAVNVLFYGYTWSYPRSFITLKVTTGKEESRWDGKREYFSFDIKLRCANVFLHRPHLLHALFGMARDAMDFATRKYTLKDLLGADMSFDEVVAVFKSQDKEEIKKIITAVLNSMEKFRKNRHNTPFSSKYIQFLRYLLDKDQDYKVFLSTKTWGSYSYSDTTWWESSKLVKIAPEFKTEVAKYFRKIKDA